MSRDCFQYLCDKIEVNVGERTFKGEFFLSGLKTLSASWDQVRVKLMHAHKSSTGRFVSGKVKLALTLRLLAGGSYLDLALLYKISSSHAYEIFHDVVRNWILDDRLVKINGLDYVNDEERLEQVALEFA